MYEKARRARREVGGVEELGEHRAVAQDPRQLERLLRVREGAAAEVVGVAVGEEGLRSSR